MEKINFNYLVENIPTPLKLSYKLKIVDNTETATETAKIISRSKYLDFKQKTRQHY